MKGVSVDNVRFETLCLDPWEPDLEGTDKPCGWCVFIETKGDLTDPNRPEFSHGMVFFGKYTEHGLGGHKVGESRRREGLFGNCSEHTDKEGKKRRARAGRANRGLCA